MSNNEKIYVGIDIGGTRIKLGMIANNGKIIVKKSFETESDVTGRDFVKNLADQVLKLIDANKNKITAIGVGCAGMVNPKNGELIFSPNIPALNNCQLGGLLGEYTGYEVYIDNDVNAMTLGEYYYGAGKGYENIITLTLGTGVGGGLIFNGKIYRGTAFTAGELGHATLFPDGLACPCGNYGCLERYVNRDGIINRVKFYLQRQKKSKIMDYLEDNNITPKSVFLAAEQGDEIARQIWFDIGRYLGIALASFINLLNPEIIIIGGGISSAADYIFPPALAEINRRAFTTSNYVTEIRQAELKNDAGIIGAAAIAIDKC